MLLKNKDKKVKRDITPYWHTLKTGGVINPKYPGGVERQKKKDIR